MQKHVFYLSWSGMRRLNRLRYWLNTMEDEKVFRFAFQVLKYFLDNRGALYIRNRLDDMEPFEIPSAPRPPRILRRRITLEVKEQPEELLEQLMLFDRGDARKISERALILTEMAMNGLVLCISENEGFSVVKAIHRIPFHLS